MSDLMQYSSVRILFVFEIFISLSVLSASGAVFSTHIHQIRLKSPDVCASDSFDFT